MMRVDRQQRRRPHPWRIVRICAYILITVLGGALATLMWSAAQEPDKPLIWTQSELYILSTPNDSTSAISNDVTWTTGGTESGLTIRPAIGSLTRGITYLIGTPEVIDSLKCDQSSRTTVSDLPGKVREILEDGWFSGGLVTDTDWESQSIPTPYLTEMMKPGDTAIILSNGFPSCSVGTGASMTAGGSTMWITAPRIFLGSYGRPISASSRFQASMNSITMRMKIPSIDWVQTTVKMSEPELGPQSTTSIKETSYPSEVSWSLQKKPPESSMWTFSYMGPMYASFTRPTEVKESQNMLFFAGILMGIASSSLLMLVEYIRGRGE